MSTAARRSETASRQAKKRVIRDGWPATASGHMKKNEIAAGSGKNSDGPTGVKSSGDCAARPSCTACMPPAFQRPKPAVSSTPTSITTAWKLSVQATARKPP